MGQFLFYYTRPEPATWVYMSTFLTIGLYFMFSRLWSLRNLDIALLLLLTPGLMMVYEGRKLQMQPTDVQQVSRLEKSRNSRPDFALFENTLSSNLQTASQESRPNENPNDNKIADAAFRDSSSEANRDEQDNGLEGQSALNASSDQSVSDPLIKSAPNNSGWNATSLLYFGFIWLLTVQGLLMIRMLLDTSLVRRPMLEPNLSIGGLTFLGVSLFLFLMANVLTSTPEDQARHGVRLGPGFVLLNQLPDIAISPQTMDMSQERGLPANPESNRTNSIVTNEKSTQLSQADSIIADQRIAKSQSRSILVARILAILSNLAIVGGLVGIGVWHFGNLKSGIGAAVFCTLMPYTAQMSGRIDHVFPAALIVLTVLMYRQPLVSGFLLGCAAGLVYYPFFLLPLWMSFYWQRGLRRFGIGLAVSILAMGIATVFLADGSPILELRRMFGLIEIAQENLGGVWGLGWHPYMRLPVLVAFGFLSFSFTMWPAQKNLATLIGCSAAIMMAAQFGHGYGGGLFMAWFLPLATLSIFRPNLDDRIALRMVRLRGYKPRIVAGRTPDREDLARAG